MREATRTARWGPRLSRGAGVLVCIAILGLIVAGPGYRAGFIDLGLALRLTIAGAVIAAIALIIGVVSILIGRRGTARGRRAGAFSALVLGLAVVLQLGSWLHKAGKVPPIHDISTDLENPPQFRAIAPLRASAPNPIDYEGEHIAAQQRAAYPALAPLVLERSSSDIILAAAETARASGWEIVELDPEGGRLEATDTTLWYGFKDDVVVRVTSSGGEARMDVRSKSRVGVSDLGTNAARILKFVEAVRERL